MPRRSRKSTKFTQIGSSVTWDMECRLWLFAQAKGLSKSAVIRMALSEFLYQQPSNPKLSKMIFTRRAKGGSGPLTVEDLKRLKRALGNPKG